MLTIYKPGEVPVRGLRTSLKGAQLGDGYFQAISNLRWDTGVLSVRGGLSVISDASSGDKTAPGSPCLGAAFRVLGGIGYVFSAWAISGKTAIYVLTLSTGVFKEITADDSTTVPTWGGTQKTSPGLAAGGTRLSVAKPVTFTVVTCPRRVVGGFTIPPRDQLVVQNGDSYPFIWDSGMAGVNNPQPDRGYWHWPISLPTGATNFTQSARFSKFLQVANSTKTYWGRLANGSGSQTDYTFADQSADPYSGANACLKITSKAAAVDKESTIVTFTTPATFPGEQINFVAEATSPSAINDIFLNAKIEIADETTGAAISSVTFNNPNALLITTSTAHNLSNNNDLTARNAVVIHGMTGIAVLANNPLLYAKVAAHGANAFELYYDQACTTPVTGTGTMGGSPTANLAPLDTVYDSASSDPAIALAPIMTGFDSLQNRTLVTYSLKNLTLGGAVKHLKFTRNGAGASSDSVVTILAIAGAGAGSGFYGDTEFQIVYTDPYSQAESGVIVAKLDDSELIKNIGGPTIVKAGASGQVEGTKIPVATTVLYDYVFHVKNPGQYQKIYGGLNGIASTLDFYFREADEPPELTRYWHSVQVYIPNGVGGRHWEMLSDWIAGLNPAQVLTIKTEVKGYGGNNPGLIDRYLRDPGIAPPSPFNTSMPRAAACWVANQRSFAGAIKDSAENYCYGDLYFSALSFPFRYQSVQDSDTAGSRLVFEGETVRAGIMSASAANGASVVYVLTDQSLNALGTAGGFVGSGYDSTSLTTRVRINSHGTNEPGSVMERAGVIFYIDQEGQIIRFDQGSGGSISRNAVDDKSKSIPSSQRGKTSAAFWKDRYYLAYTPAGGSANTHILGWNEVLKEWEFDDALPPSDVPTKIVVASQIVRVFDPTQSGSGQRLLLFGSTDNKVYAYEEGTAEPGSATGPLVQLRTREIQTPNLNLFRFGTNQVMIDHHPQVFTGGVFVDVYLNVDTYYKPRGTQFRGQLDCTDSDSPAKQQALRKDDRIRVEQTGTGASENGWSGFLDFNGYLGAGKTLWRIESEVEMLSTGAGDR